MIIYIQFNILESIVVYHINKKSYMNSVIHNNENLPKEIDDIRYEKVYLII